jgi:hypothetical protein
MAIYQQHGDRAALWLAERVGSLATAGDQAGVERFRQIAIKLDLLFQAEKGGGTSRALRRPGVGADALAASAVDLGSAQVGIERGNLTHPLPTYSGQEEDCRLPLAFAASS